MKEQNTVQKELSAIFSNDDIEWRIQTYLPKSDNSGQANAIVVPYLTSRAIMNRLDDVVGICGWNDSYELIQYTDGDKLEYGFKCTLSVIIDGVMVSKQDAAPFTDIEPIKGGCSDALKRAAVKFGIGRHLYELSQQYIDVYLTAPKDPGYVRTVVKKVPVYFYPPRVDQDNVVHKTNIKPKSNANQTKTAPFDKQKYIDRLPDILEKLDALGISWDKVLARANMLFGVKKDTFDEVFAGSENETKFASFFAYCDGKIKDLSKAVDNG